MDKTGTDLDYVTSNLNRSVTLIGSNLAIFTFVLIFLYPRYFSDQLNDVLFQATLTSSLLAISPFGISGVHYFEVVAMSKASIATKMQLIRRGDSIFVLSLLISVLL